MPISENLKINLNIKTFVAVIFWVASMVGMYFTMKGKVDTALEKSIAVERQLKENNLELLKYRLDDLSKKLDKILEAIE
jgi:hypothetical protein